MRTSLPALICRLFPYKHTQKTRDRLEQVVLADSFDQDSARQLGTKGEGKGEEDISHRLARKKQRRRYYFIKRVKLWGYSSGSRITPLLLSLLSLASSLFPPFPCRPPPFPYPLHTLLSLDPICGITSALLLSLSLSHFPFLVGSI